MTRSIYTPEGGVHLDANGAIQYPAFRVSVPYAEDGANVATLALDGRLYTNPTVWAATDPFNISVSGGFYQVFSPTSPTTGSWSSVSSATRSFYGDRSAYQTVQIPDKSNQQANTLVESAAVAIADFNGGQVLIRVLGTANAEPNGVTTVTVTIGGQEHTFNIRTEAAHVDPWDPYPDGGGQEWRVGPNANVFNAAVCSPGDTIIIEGDPNNNWRRRNLQISGLTSAPGELPIIIRNDPLATGPIRICNRTPADPTGIMLNLFRSDDTYKVTPAPAYNESAHVMQNIIVDGCTLWNGATARNSHQDAIDNPGIIIENFWVRATVSGVAVKPTAGATYTNNGATFTVQSTAITGGSGTIVLEIDGVHNLQDSGTLTKTSGTGDATIAFSSWTAPTISHGLRANGLCRDIIVRGVGIDGGWDGRTTDDSGGLYPLSRRGMNIAIKLSNDDLPWRKYSDWNATAGFPYRDFYCTNVVFEYCRMRKVSHESMYLGTNTRFNNRDAYPVPISGITIRYCDFEDGGFDQVNYKFVYHPDKSIVNEHHHCHHVRGGSMGFFDPTHIQGNSVSIGEHMNSLSMHDNIVEEGGLNGFKCFVQPEYPQAIFGTDGILHEFYNNLFIDIGINYGVTGTLNQDGYAITVGSSNVNPPIIAYIHNNTSVGAANRAYRMNAGCSALSYMNNNISAGSGASGEDANQASAGTVGAQNITAQIAALNFVGESDFHLQVTSPAVGAGNDRWIVIYVGGITTAPTAGAVYTNNGGTFTVVSATLTGVAPNRSGYLICTAGQGSTPLTGGGSLVKTSGTGDAAITFSDYDRALRPATDLDDVNRPATGFDVGCYEYVA